ncbi:MAG: YceD family protein [Gammaproteobacteria bacterium]
MRTAMVAGGIGSAELADLVARGATLEFRVGVSTLTRLAALSPVAAVEAASLNAGLTFRPGSEGHPQLRLTVAGSVPLVCQRCLDLLVLPVQVDVLLTMVRNDQEAAGLADPFDTVLLADGGLVPELVVEDEVLAALPLAPRHAESDACGREERANSGEMHRPLAGLADLLGRGDRQGDK